MGAAVLPCWCRRCCCQLAAVPTEPHAAPPCAHAANMDASATGAGLEPLRAAVGEAAAAAEAARLHLYRRYREEQAQALQAAGGYAGGDFACQAWLHAMLRSMDEASFGRGLFWAGLQALRWPAVPHPASCPPRPFLHCRPWWLPACCCWSRRRTATACGRGCGRGAAAARRPREDGCRRHLNEWSSPRIGPACSASARAGEWRHLGGAPRRHAAAGLALHCFC